MSMAYIHSKSDWSVFHWDSRGLIDRLAHVRFQQELLHGRMNSLGHEFRDEAMLLTLTQDVLKSSEIEGVLLNGDQVRSSIARQLGIEIGALPPADRQVEGIVEMTLDATSHYDKPLTAERLQGWHAALFPTGYANLRRIPVGTWRNDHSGPMQVVSGRPGRERVHFEAPPADRIDSEIAAFLDWFERKPDTDSVLVAAIAHLWFVTIHPFEDGNGRIARAITDMALARSGGDSRRYYSMSSQIRQERNDYYEILERTQKDDMDISPWLHWFLGCLGRALERTEEVLSNVLQKAHFWREHAQLSVNPRQREMLNRLMEGFEGKLTSSKWAKIGKCSPDTALRDITELIKYGVLRKAKGGGRSTNYLLILHEEQNRI